LYFPVFDKHGISMDTSRAQHQSFLGGVTATLEYLATVDPRKPNPAPFSAKKLRELIDSFVPLACIHMAEELGSLNADLLREKGVTIEELDAANKAVEEHTKTQFNPLTFLPGLYYSRPEGCGFPEAPWFVGAILSPLFSAVNPRRWKYYYSEKRWEKTPPTALT